jgi:hypothetical protein
MKYNNIVSIFLLILAIVISQSVHMYTHRKIIEGWWGWFNWGRWRRDRERQERARRKREADMRAAAEAAEAALRNRFRSDSPFVNLLGQAYLDSRTGENEKVFNEASEVYNSISSTIICQNDTDVSEIIKKTADMLNNPSKQNTTKVYFLSETISKAFSIIKTKEKNFLIVHYKLTIVDDDTVKDKYKKIQSLLALAEISNINTTSAEAYPGRDAFNDISTPIITEARNIVNEFMNIMKAKT